MNEWMNDQLSYFCNCARLSGNGVLWAPPHIVNKIPIYFLDLSSSSSIFWIHYVRRWLSFLFDTQQHPKSFLERTEEFAEKVLWGGKCLRCPSFQGATLFIVTLSDHIVPKESHEGASKQSGFSAPFCTPLPLVEGGGTVWSCLPRGLCFLDTCLPSRLIWQGPGHPLPYQRREAGSSKLSHLCPWASHWTSLWLSCSHL